MRCGWPAYVAITAIPALVLAAVVTERAQAEEALRESERQFRTITEQMNDVVYVTDTEGTITYISPASEPIFGYRPDEMQGRRFAVFLDEAEVPKARAAFTDAVAHGMATKVLELLMRRKDGTAFCGELSGTVYRREGVAGTMGIIRDVTERKRAEEEREKLNAQLAQAQKMDSIGTLAGGIAHDFNNILGVILGHAELALADMDSSQPAHADLTAIQKAAQRSAALTRQLLAFARRQTVAPLMLDLNGAVEQTLAMIGRLIGEDIRLQWTPGAELWPVKMDPAQIDQILTNLALNARDAGAGQIVIATGNVALDEASRAGRAGFVPGEYVMLSVGDDGGGMDGIVLGHVFEPFFTTKEVGKGTGLGLATVYGIVRQNDGLIDVDSQPGRGTTLRIYLPRCAGESVVAPVAAAAAEPAQGLGQTVLLVEDQAALLSVGKTMLRRLGYTVLTATTPADAIRQAEAHRGVLSLVITDVVMPEMNGRELARRVKAMIPDMKCLFMSGYPANVMAARGILDEDTPFLRKPFSMNDLAAGIREVLGRPA